MAPTSGQGLQTRQQPSSSSSSGRRDDVSKFSLLGQEFKCHCPAQHHGQSSQPELISLSMASLSSQNHVPPLSQCPAALDHGGNNRVNAGNSGLGRSFSNVQCQQIPPAQGYNPPFGAHDINQSSSGENTDSSHNAAKACNPQVLLNTLSILEQKIHQLKSLVRLMAQEDEQTSTSIDQQQAVMTSVASIVSQLMVAAAGMFPSSQQLGLILFPSSTNLQLAHLFGVAPGLGLNAFQQNEIGNSTIETMNTSVVGDNPFGLESSLGGPHIGATAVSSHSVPTQTSLGSSNTPRALDTSLNTGPGDDKTIGGDADASNFHNGNGTANPSRNSSFTSQGSGGTVSLDDHDIGGTTRDEDDDGEGENLPPGSYELIEMNALEILAEHKHFCDICGKGFKRDANLRMHMRGHGDEYKTAAALAKPDKAQDPSPVQPRRYSCPCVGCKRNKKHKKFQPLKTVLCVKNHYRRSHCPKMFTCNRCKKKKFSVVADLKTHEKHCGRDKWQCSCGTTFSRKDKLFGHIALFQGHTPAFPPNEIEGLGLTDQGANRGPHTIKNTGSNYTNACGNIAGVLASSGVVDSSYGNGNASSMDPGTNGTGLETGDGSVHGRLKDISFSEEDNGHTMQEGFLTHNVWVSSGSFCTNDKGVYVPCLAL